MAMLKLCTIVSVCSCRIPKLFFRAIVNCCLVSGFCSLAVSKCCFFFSPAFAFLSFSARFPINRLWSLPTSTSILVLTSCTERLHFPFIRCNLFDSQFCLLWISMSAYLLSYVGRVSLQSLGHSPHICHTICCRCQSS